MRAAHKFTNRNYEFLKEEQQCRCIYCKKEFMSSDIDEYTADNTALCPKCWIDAVIGESSGYILDDEFVDKMYEFFFNNDGPMSEHILDLDLENLLNK